MSYQVLARKWRPNTFAELVGQEHVVTAISNALENNRLHHAYLFTGTRGVGKTTIARIFSKSLNCDEGQSATPCGQCHTCLEIEQGNYVDLLEIDAASRTKVEDTRELLDNVQYKPTRGRFKVYLIDEVHMLSKHSFNALLKTLEEPPPHVKFLLATTDPQKLPVTILSRCLQFNLKALSRDQIKDQLVNILRQEGIDYEDNALALLARAAQGSMRDALSLTDQAIAQGNNRVMSAIVTDMLGLMDRHQLLKLLYAVVQKDPEKVMSLVSTIAEQAPDYGQMLAEISSLLHQVALTQWIPDVCKLETTSAKAIYKLAQQLPPEQVQLMYQITLQGRKDLPFAVDGRSGTEMTLMRMMAFTPVRAVADVEETITNSVPAGTEAGHTDSNPESLRTSPDLAQSSQENSVEGDHGAESRWDNSREASVPETMSDVKTASDVDDSSRTDEEFGHQEVTQYEPEQSSEQTEPEPLTSTKEMLELRQRLKRSRKEEADTKVKKLNSPSWSPSPGASALESEAKNNDSSLHAPADDDTSDQTSLKHPNNDKSPPPWVTDVPHEVTDNGPPYQGDDSPASQEELGVQRGTERSHQTEESPNSATSDSGEKRENEVALKVDYSGALTAYLPDGSKLTAASQIDDWSRLVEQMPVAGLVKQIALHSAMEQVDDHITLELDPSQQHLLNESAEAQLRDALSSALGYPIKLHVVTGSPQLTPFSLQQKINEMRQRYAQQVVESDEVIQSLSNVFSATVLPDSIQAR